MVFTFFNEIEKGQLYIKTENIFWMTNIIIELLIMTHFHSGVIQSTLGLLL